MYIVKTGLLSHWTHKIHNIEAISDVIILQCESHYRIS